MTNHQRKGSLSNADVGRKLKEEAKRFFSDSESMTPISNYPISIGLEKVSKPRRFHHGSDIPEVLIEFVHKG